MFKTRLVSGIILVVLAMVVVYAGSDVMLAVLALVSLVGIYELNRVFKTEKCLLGIFSYVSTICYFIQLRFGFLVEPQLCFTAYMLFLLAIYVFTFPKFNTAQIVETFFGFFYVSVMLSYIYRLRIMDNGACLVLLIVICSWGCDTCAYAVGMLFGKHKMSPLLSPKKSIEGAIGGVVGSALLTILFGYLFAERLDLSLIKIVFLTIFCALAALVSMVGDLAASAIKRNYNIKDYGDIIPGHGGILDRFDSVIITAPIVYYLCVLVLG